MKKILLLGLIAILGLLSLPSTQILAQVPKLLNFSGNLWDNTQNPAVPVNATGQPVFVEIYDQPTGGVAIWSDQFQVDVVNGYFSVNLGSGTEALDIAFDKPYYVQVKIGNNGTPTARVPLTSSAYALNADKAAYALEVADGSVTQAKLAPGIQALPIGPAGGDLMGTYPNPEINPDKILESIEPGSITQDKLAPNVTTPPSGPASGDLTGSYPDPLIAPGAVRTDRIADGAVISQKIASRTILNGNIALHQITNDLMDNTDDFTFNSVTTANSVNVGSDLVVNGTSTLNGSSTINNTLNVNGSSTFANDVQITGNTTINSNLVVDGTSTLNDMLTVTANGADITGDVNLNNNLNVVGSSTFTDAVTANNGVTVTNGLTADTGMIGSATATNLTGTNVNYASGTVTTLGGSNLNYTSGIVSSVSGTDLSYTNGTFTNLTITNLTVTNLTATDGTFTNNLTVGNDLSVGGNISGTLANSLTAGDGIIPFTYNNSATATVGIADLGVTTAKIDNLAVTNGKIADDAVTEPKIGASNAAVNGYVLGYNGADLQWVPGSVETEGLITGDGTSGNKIRLDETDGLANHVIIKNPTNTAWVTSTINGGIIDDGSITTDDIADGTIVNADVSATAAIAYSKLNLANQIVSTDIVDGTIATNDLGDKQVTAPKISSTGVGAGNVLISDGAGSATWSNDPLALDYAGTYAGNGDAFSITHTGTSGKVMNLAKTNAANTSAVLALQGNNLLFDATGTSASGSYTAQIKNTTTNGRALLLEGNSVNPLGTIADPTDVDNAVLVVRNTSAGNPGNPIAGAEGKTAIKTYGDIWANSAIGGSSIVAIDRVIVGTGATSVTITPPANVGDPLNFSDDVEIGSSTTSADLKVWGDVWAQGTVTGSSISFTSATFDNLAITNDLNVGGNTTLANLNATGASFTSLNNTGATTLGSTLNVSGATTLAGLTASSSSVTGNSNVNGNLVVDGTLNFDAGQTVNEIVTTVSGTSTDMQLPTAKSVWTLVNSISASNGLTNNSGTFELGGNLNKPTAINNNGFDLSVGSTTFANSGAISTSGNVTTTGTLNVTGLSTLGDVNAAAASFTTLNTTGATTLGSTLNVSGNTTLANMTSTAATLTTADIDGGTIDAVAINGSTIGGTTAAAASFTTLDASGATTLGSTLNVTGATTLAGLTASSSSVTGNSNINGNLVVDGTLNFDAGQTVDEIVTTVSGASTDMQLPTAKSVWTLVNSISASNGLTNNSGTFELGGNLNKPTAINNNGFDLSVGSTTFANSGAISTSGNVTTTGTLNVTGLSTLGDVNAAAASFTTLNATGATTLGSTLNVSGNTTLANMTSTAATLTTADIDGGTIDAVAINGSTIGGTTAAAASFTTLDASGATTLGSTLNVTGATTLAGLTASSSTVTGNSNINGNLVVDGTFNFDAGQTVDEIVTSISNASTDMQLPTAKATWDLVANIPVNNGLTNNSGTIQLGGSLNQSTTITTTGTNDFILNGTGEAAFYNGEGVYVDSGILTVGSSSNGSSAEFVGGTVSFTGSNISQTGASNTVTFEGNVDAKNGLDVTGALLTASNGLTANAATLTTADINGGTIDNTIIGGTTAAAASFTDLHSTSFNLNNSQEVDEIVTSISNASTDSQLPTAKATWDLVHGIPANNGITNNSGTFQLGGTLNQNTTIANGGFSLTFDGTAGDVVLASTGALTAGNGATVNGAVLAANAGLTSTSGSFGTTLEVDGTTQLDGATTINNTLTQTGAANQVTFAGNIDANNGLDVTGADLTVGGTKFTVDDATGNIASDGSINVKGNSTLGDDATLDNVIVNASMDIRNSITNTSANNSGRVNISDAEGLSVTGSYISTNGNIELTNGNITVGGNYTTTNGNITSTNGALTLTNGNLTVGGIATFNGDVNVNDEMRNNSPSGTLTLLDNDGILLSSTSGIALTGPVTASSTLAVSGNASFNGNVTLGDAAGDAITSTGAFTASNGATVNGAVLDVNAGLTANAATLTTADINGGTIDGATIGNTTAAAATFTDLHSASFNLGNTQEVDAIVTTISATSTNSQLPTAKATWDLLGNLVAENGVTKSGNTFKLGGNLTASTTLTNNGHSLTIDGSAGDVVIASTGALSATNGLTTNAATLTTADINGGTIDGATIGNTTAAAATFTTADINGGTIDGATIGNTTAAAATFTTVSITGGSLTGLTNVSATNGTFTNLNNTTIGNTTAGAATFTTIKATGAVTFESTLAVTGATTFTGSSTFLGDVTLGDASTDAIIANGYFKPQAGIAISTMPTVNDIIGIVNITGGKRGLYLQSSSVANSHEASFIQLSDAASQTHTNTGFAIEADGLQRAYGLNINTPASPAATGSGNPNSNVFRTHLEDATDVGILLTSETGGAGSDKGTALNIKGDTPSSSFTAIKVDSGRLVWSTLFNANDVDATLDGAYTMHILRADFTVGRTFTLPGASAINGQIVYISYYDTVGGTAAAVAPGGTAAIVGSTTLNSEETCAFIFYDNVWYRLN